jgi:putative PIN family toxin of toxin-antitoxin system
VPTPPFRIVLDTNVLLRGILNAASTAGRVVDTCDRRSVILLLSKPILSEYREVLTDQRILERYPELTVAKVDFVLRRLRYVANMAHAMSVEFEYPRDAKDEKFIELAIARRATHIVTFDKDLLSLTSGHGDFEKRFRQRAPSVLVLDAMAFARAAEL